MGQPLQKAPSIIRILDGLKERLGEEAFTIVDHWKADLCAIGLARSDNPSVLVYISTHSEEEALYSVSLELPPQQDSPLPYTAAGEHGSISLDELATIVSKHFQHGLST